MLSTDSIVHLNNGQFSLIGIKTTMQRFCEGPSVKFEIFDTVIPCLMHERVGLDLIFGQFISEDVIQKGLSLVLCLIDFIDCEILYCQDRQFLDIYGLCARRYRR